MQIKKILLRTVFFLGWLLSPFTFWNDAFVNIPLSYICASLTLRFVHTDFLLTVLVFYWLSNGIGLIMMYASGRYLAQGKKDISREFLLFILTILVYSIVLIMLNSMGILKPALMPK